MRDLLLRPLLVFAVGIGLGACTQPPAPTAADATPAATAGPAAVAAATPADPAKHPDAYPFHIGTLQAWALKDGDIDIPNDGSVFGIGQPAAQVDAVLTAANLPTDMLHLSIQPLLVRSGARLLLFDTGAGDASFARAGRLPAALRAAGVTPQQVTDIFLSHRHPDHVGGLLGKDGSLAFPAATVHLTDAEWQALQRDPAAATLSAALAPKVASFAPGAVLLQGVVTAVAVDGHTPGHSAYRIGAGDAQLLYIGDAAHHAVISVQRPQWTVQFDENAALAETSRAALLQRAADAGERVYAVHFPYPGLGTIEAWGEGLAWAPEERVLQKNAN